MSTSGVTTYSRTAQQVIDAAYRKTGVMAKGQSADAEELSIGIETLNLAIAELRTYGLNLWKVQTVTLPIVAGTATYTLTQPAKPNKVLQGWAEDIVNPSSKIPLEIVSVFNYNKLPLNSNGTPVQLTYIPGKTFGTVTLWPSPNTTTVNTKNIKLVVEGELELITDAGQDIDIPTEWYNAVIYYLSSLLTNELNVPIQDRDEIQKKAMYHIELAQEAGQENASLFFQPIVSR